MPITTEFAYHKPQDLAEATGLLARYGGRAAPLAGGTDLLLWLKEGLKAPEAVIDIKGVPELWHLDTKGGVLAIGARVTFTELIESELVKKHFPVLWEAARTVASCGVRNRATLAGNLCSAVPSLDGAPALLVHAAGRPRSGRSRSPNGSRAPSARPGCRRSSSPRWRSPCPRGRRPAAT